MKKKLIILLTLILLNIPIWCYAFGLMMAASVGGGAVPADYCSTQAWNTYTGLSLDFDHTTDTKTACLAASTELGVTSAGSAISTPTPASPATSSVGSGANALVADATAEYINFDNTAPYIRSVYGSLMFKFLSLGNESADHPMIHIIGSANDYLQCVLESSGQLDARWKDNAGTLVTVIVTSSTYDVDNNYNHWCQVMIEWDTTRCTQGDGNCADAGEDELKIKARYDSNDDGDFDDGTAENWSTYYSETSNVDMEVFSAEPGTDDVLFGLISGTYASGFYFDDLEISYNQPSW